MITRSIFLFAGLWKGSKVSDGFTDNQSVNHCHIVSGGEWMGSV